MIFQTKKTSNPFLMDLCLNPCGYPSFASKIIALKVINRQNVFLTALPLGGYLYSAGNMNLKWSASRYFTPLFLFYFILLNCPCKSNFSM
jgi:hypothetical protein